MNIGMKLLQALRPAMAIIPEVTQPDRKVQFKTRAIQTIIIVLIYLVCCQIPIYGIVATSGSDPFYWMRVILASNRGTLMELGISPSVTAGMVMQLLSGANLLKVDQKDKHQKALFNGAQKLLGLAIGFFEAFAYVWSGMYGDLDKIGAGNAILIILQLTFAGVVVLMLDELLTNGYGLGNSAISLFISINVCETILWKSFSPMTYPTENGQEYEGAIIGLFASLISFDDKLKAIQNAFFRSSLPNLNSLIATVFIFLVVINFQGYKVDIPIKNNKVAGATQSYPIKLFYTSNIPIILQTALVSNLYFLSQILYRNFRGNFLIGLLGTWHEVEMGGSQYAPVGGLVYYISPPRGISEIIFDPIHTLLYIIFVLGTCAVFSKTWIEISGSSAKDVARQLKDQDMSLPGSRDTYLKEKLRSNITIAATLGGMCIGALSILADFLNVIGSGTGMLLAVTNIYGYFEQLKKEKDQGTLTW